MRRNILDICFILILIIIIVFTITHIYKQTINEDRDILEEMAENMPEENIEEVAEEEDILITSTYEIDGKTYEIIAVLKIPSLGIEYPVLSTTSKELLKVSLNKYWGPNPNRKGNFCILGHNYNDERFFGKLNQIKKRDKIELTDMTGTTLDYYVYNTFIAEPEDTSCTSQKEQLAEGKTEITLITCTKNFKQRFIVKARAN
jgi:sortase A